MVFECFLGGTNDFVTFYLWSSNVIKIPDAALSGTNDSIQIIMGLGKLKTELFTQAGSIKFVSPINHKIRLWWKKQIDMGVSVWKVVRKFVRF